MIVMGFQRCLSLRVRPDLLDEGADWWKVRRVLLFVAVIYYTYGLLPDILSAFPHPVIGSPSYVPS